MRIIIQDRRWEGQAADGSRALFLAAFLFVQFFAFFFMYCFVLFCLVCNPTAVRRDVR